jgi:dihydropyrimidinase/allantoinase
VTVARYDLIIKGGRVVLADVGEFAADIGVRDGRVAAVAEDLPPSEGDAVEDATGKVVLPGAVDAHFHIGIYQPLAEDAFAETRSSLVGGVTTVISYFRTGSHYLNKTGPYREIFPEVLEQTAGRAHTDFGYHLAPMTSEQVDEVDWLVSRKGVASFKYYMFYQGLNLAADSTDAAAYTMADSYDLGHLYAIMEAVAAAGATVPGRVSLSVHCEQPELLTYFIDRVRSSGRPQDLAAYSDSRPALAERVAIGEAVELAAATGCPVNLLHLSSGEALQAAIRARAEHPDLDIRLEATLHHLALSHEELSGLGAKVNPPIRSREDINTLWTGVELGWIDWVASDHACCMSDQKGEDLWPALPGFGGTALLYPALLSEGHHRRGLPLEQIVRLASTNPARAYGLYPRKGTIAVGSDADLTIVDLEREQTVGPELLLSRQDHTPFDGVAVRGWPQVTILRGRIVYRDGDVLGDPSGRYLERPV